MNINKSASYFFIGLALFAMFFGSGNLIFPLEVGRAAQAGWPLAALGFLITAVLIPFMGVFAMVVLRGRKEDFFNCMGKTLGTLIIALVLTVWIPLGSGPRCIVLAYSSMSTQLPMPTLWLFSLLWSVAVWFVIYQKNRMLDILGYFLTPLLLLCIGTILYLGLQAPGTLTPSTETPWIQIFNGAKEGYNTMDLIASFFFSASIIEILKRAAHSKTHHPLRITFKAGAIGIGLLGIVYLGLICLAAYHADILIATPKEQLLATVATTILGPQFSLVAVSAIFLACFTTAVALAIVYSEFLNRFIPNEKICMGITLASSWAMSLLGLSGITALTGPILQAFYPFLIGLIVFNLAKHYLAKRREKMSVVENKIVSS